MTHNHTLRKWIAVLLGGLLFWASGCDEAATDPNPATGDLELSAAAQGVAVTGWQTVNNLKTQQQFGDLVSGSGDIITDEAGMISSSAEMRRETARVARVYQFAQQAGSLAKTTADSLIWSEEWDDPISGTAGRRALIYDDETGIGRIYEVIYKFPAQLQLRYDSTEIRIDLNTTLLDSTDDKLLQINKLSEFREGFPVQKVTGEGIVTDWSGSNEITGAIVTNIVEYGDQRNLEKLTQVAEFNPDGSGAVSETFDFRDNTSTQKSVTFNADHTGTFSETWRNGTTVNGTFDDFADDNHAALTRNIDFANHPWLDKMTDRAEYTLDPADSSSDGTVARLLYFLNGNLDSMEVQAHREFDGAYWTESLQIQTANDGATNFTVIEKDNFDEFDGEHFSPDGYYVQFNGIDYDNGSGELWLSVYASKTAFDNGEPPILSAHYIYNPDGSGTGTITENGGTYNVKFDANGKIEVVDSDGRSVALNGFN